MMSHCDPHVSSTDVHPAAWEGEGEDEFGVFTSAPGLLPHTPPDSGKCGSEFQADWSLFESGGEVPAASGQLAVDIGTESPAILEANVNKSHDGTNVPVTLEASANTSNCGTKTSAVLETSVNHWQSNNGINTNAVLEADVSYWQSDCGVKTKAVLGSSTNFQQLDNESMTSAVSEESVTQSHCGIKTAVVSATNVNLWQSDPDVMTNAMLEDDVNQSDCVSGREAETSSQQETDGAEDDFADFQAFDDTPHRQDRPQVVDLPLHIVALPGLDPGTEWCGEITGKRTRESAVIDSGVFSADLSPVPVSDTLSNSEGERAGQSDDEGLSDLPQDNSASTHTGAETATGLSTEPFTEAPTEPDTSTEASVKNNDVRNREKNDSKSHISHNDISQSQKHIHHSRHTLPDEDRSSQSGNRLPDSDTVASDRSTDVESLDTEEWTTFKTSHSLPQTSSKGMPSSSASEDGRVSNMKNKYTSCGMFSESIVPNSVPCSSDQLVSDHCHTRNTNSSFIDTDSSSKDTNIPYRSIHCSKDDMTGSIGDDTLNQHSWSTVGLNYEEREKNLSASNSSPTTYDDHDDNFGDFTSQPVIMHKTSDVRPLTTCSPSAFLTETHNADSSLGDSASALLSDSAARSGEDSEQKRGWDQAAVSTSDCSWAEFAASHAGDDFGEFSDFKTPSDGAVSTHLSEARDSGKSKCSDFEGALLTCFPGSVTQTSRSGGGDTDSGSDHTRQDKSSWNSSLLSHTVLHTKLTSDVGSRLWNRVHDVDRSPAVTYQWSQSHTHSRLFHTLRLDTHTMLPGNKKPTVPVYAADLSVLKPVRRKDGEKAGREKPALVSTTLSNQPLTQHVTKNAPRVNQTRTSGGVAYPLSNKHSSKMHR